MSWNVPAVEASHDPHFRTYSTRQVESTSAVQKIEVAAVRRNINDFRQVTWKWQDAIMAPRTPTKFQELKIRGLGWLQWSKRYWAERSREAKKRAQAILSNHGYLPPTKARILGHWLAQKLYGWTGVQWNCLDELWGTKDGQTLESGWWVHADNPGSPAFGIPQADPGIKMATKGSNWKDSAYVQIIWGLDYIRDDYGSPCNALQVRLEKHSY